LRNLLRKAATNNGLEFDYSKFDWIVNEEKQNVIHEKK
jgi:hypothetical protein